MCTIKSLMSFPPPISVVTYTKISYLLFNSCSKTASKSALYIATDTYERYTISGDDTWSKTEYSSINVLVTLISKENGKCIDSYVVSKKCEGCSLWANEKDIKNGLPIMFVRRIFLDRLVQWNQQELLICSNVQLLKTIIEILII